MKRYSMKRESIKHSKFRGLRDDKEPKAIVKERPGTIESSNG